MDELSPAESMPNISVAVPAFGAPLERPEVLLAEHVERVKAKGDAIDGLASTNVYRGLGFAAGLYVCLGEATLLAAGNVQAGVGWGAVGGVIGGSIAAGAGTVLRGRSLKKKLDIAQFGHEYELFRIDNEDGQPDVVAYWRGPNQAKASLSVSEALTDFAVVAQRAGLHV